MLSCLSRGRLLKGDCQTNNHSYKGNLHICCRRPKVQHAHEQTTCSITSNLLLCAGDAELDDHDSAGGTVDAADIQAGGPRCGDLAQGEPGVQARCRRQQPGWQRPLRAAAAKGAPGAAGNPERGLRPRTYTPSASPAQHTPLPEFLSRTFHCSPSNSDLLRCPSQIIYCLNASKCLLKAALGKFSCRRRPWLRGSLCAESPRQSTQPIAAGARPSTESALVSSSGQDPAHKSSPLTYTSLGNEGAEGAHLGSSLGGSFRSSSLIRQAALPAHT